MPSRMSASDTRHRSKSKNRITPTSTAHPPTMTSAAFGLETRIVHTVGPALGRERAEHLFDRGPLEREVMDAVAVVGR